MNTASETLHADPVVVGLLPEGVNAKMADEVARHVQERVEHLAEGLTVRSVRMVPSSTMHLDSNTVQFIANATVVPLSQDGRPARAKVIDSVVTLIFGKNNSVQIKEVAVPFLERQTVAA